MQQVMRHGTHFSCKYQMNKKMMEGLKYLKFISFCSVINVLLLDHHFIDANLSQNNVLISSVWPYLSGKMKNTNTTL